MSQFANPDFTNASVQVTETFNNSFGAALEGGASASGGQAAGSNEAMYLYLKAENAVTIADLGLELSAGQEMIVACSDQEKDANLYPYSSAEIRNSKSLDYVIKAGTDLKFKWAEGDSFEFDGAQSADKKWNPQKLQLADLETEAIKAGSGEFVGSVSADSVASSTISLDGEDLGSSLTGLENADSSATTDRGAIRTEFAAADSTLQSNIDSEASSRASADSAMAADIATINGGENDAGSFAKAVKDASDALKNNEIAAASAAAAVADQKAVQAQAEVDAAEVAAAALAVRVSSEESLSATQNSRLDALEASDSSTATTITGIQTAATAAGVERQQQADNLTSLATSAGNTQSSLAQEIQDRAAAVAGVQAEVDALEVVHANDKGVADADRADIRVDFAAADASEATARAAEDSSIRTDFAAADAALDAKITSNDTDIANLSSQLQSVISNTDASAIDSLSEIVAEFQSADATLSSSITSVLGTHSSELNALKDGSSSTIKDLDDDVAANAAAVAAEETARVNAVAAEATSRANAISAEETARVNADNALDSKIDQLKGEDIGLSLDGSTPAMSALYPGTDDVKELLEKEAGNTYLAAMLIHGLGAGNGWNDYKTALQNLPTPVTPGPGSLITMLEQVIADAAANASAAAQAQSEVDALESLHASDKSAADSARAQIASDLSDEETRASAAEAAISAALSAEESARIADVDAEQARAESAEATLTASAAANAASISQEATDRQAAVTAEAAARAAAIGVEEARAQAAEATLQSNMDAMRIETFHMSGSESGYCSSMYLKSGDMPSNVNSPRFTADSACHEYSISFSEDLPDACEVQIKLLGSDGSSKATETVSFAQGDSYKVGSFSMSPVAGDRLAFKVSSGVCKDPVVSVSCSKNP